MTMDQGSHGDQPSGQGGQDRLQEAAGGVAERVTDTAQQQVSTRVDSQLGRAGDMLEQVATAVRRSGDQMRDQQPQIANIADTAAEQVEKASRFLRETDMNGLVHGAETFARQQPAVFIGGALALGLVASRFLKASPQQANGDGFRSGVASGYGSDYGYGSSGTYGSTTGLRSSGGYGGTSTTGAYDADRLGGASTGLTSTGPADGGASEGEHGGI